jgi:hypothetical protein
LAHACKAADRVVVVLNTPPKRTPDGHSTKGDRIACEVVGTDEVLDFLSIVSFKASIPGLTCACNGDVKLELANGRQTLATLTWHDGSHLRWHDGTWLGDTCLTQKSRQALSAWIDREGGEALEQARTKANAQWEEFRTTQEAEWKAEEAASTRTAQDDVKNE